MLDLLLSFRLSDKKPIVNPDFAIAKYAHRAAPPLCALGALIVEKLIIEKESEKPLYFIIKKTR
jgi:hypothetical protein